MPARGLARPSAAVFAVVHAFLASASSLIASALIGFWALRRYLYLLNHAEFVADLAVCRACDTWEILNPNDAGQPAQDRLRVRCKRCGHVWFIEL
ncbi:MULTISPECIES: MJ0042-type zinc finger domain-containing protein [unclassified Variovorax]|uniref:MJ0042-type zinc finger domain-containing protein n=1 Tax=unclassified Variovorax TaxID=663243 RepID=UPI003ECCAFBB